LARDLSPVRYPVIDDPLDDSVMATLEQVGETGSTTALIACACCALAKINLGAIQTAYVCMKISVIYCCLSLDLCVQMIKCMAFLIPDADCQNLSPTNSNGAADVVRRVAHNAWQGIKTPEGQLMVGLAIAAVI
jgi:hypothetical protein